jgi:ubiquinone/menaquinone biosynthesis C-methylase UbiE
MEDSLQEQESVLLQGMFEVPIVNLVTSDPEFAGIFTPLPELGADKVGITDQFLKEAETYSETYSNTEHFLNLFKKGFDECDFKTGGDKLILDIGCGSGANGVIPCLQLFDSCRIVATDLSPNLLRLLRRYVTASSLQNRVFCVASDAMKDFLKPAQFDFVTGGSILHHLIDPVLALRTTFRVLKPGGCAFFFEPFEGCAFIRIAFTFILEAANRMQEPIADPVQKFLRAMIEDFRVRTGVDKSAPLYRHLDDKWLFTRRYLEQVAERIGFASVRIVPQAAHATEYRDFVQSLLRTVRLDNVGLPDWAWDMIGAFDISLSPEMKWDLPLEGIIILKRK